MRFRNEFSVIFIIQCSQVTSINLLFTKIQHKDSKNFARATHTIVLHYVHHYAFMISIMLSLIRHKIISTFFSTVFHPKEKAANSFMKLFAKSSRKYQQQQQKQHNIVKFLFDIRNIIFYGSCFFFTAKQQQRSQQIFLWLWCEYKFLHIQTHSPNIWQQKTKIIHCLHHKLACRTLWRTGNFISCFLWDSIHESGIFMLTFSETSKNTRKHKMQNWIFLWIKNKANEKQAKKYKHNERKTTLKLPANELS